MNEDMYNFCSSRVELRIIYLEVNQCSTVFSEGGFVLKSISQINIAGGNYLKKYENYNDLPLTLSVTEVAAVLGISRAGAYELVHATAFPKVKIGKRILVPKDKLIAWLDAQVEVED